VLGVNLDHEGLRAMAERFVMLLRNLLKPWDKSALGIEATVGATMVRRGDSTDSLLSRAEQVLDEAKVLGGGRLIIGE